MFAKRAGMVLVAGLAMGGAGVAGAQPADAAAGCDQSWERVKSYPSGVPSVSMYITDVYSVTTKNCGPDGDLSVDIARFPDKCLGFVGSGQTVTKEITTTYQDAFPWKAAPPKPQGIKDGC